MNILVLKRENYRLWFEFYKLALSSTDATVKKALKKTSVRYERWGQVAGVKFDTWWRSHAFLFEETKQIRLLVDGETAQIENCVVVEIPLNKSATDLATEVRRILVAEYEKQARRKSKKIPSTAYQLSDGAEPKLASIREMLNVYRDVYLKNTNLRGEKLLTAAQSYYKNRKNKRWARIPMSLETASGDSASEYKERPMRNLRRYIQKAEKIVLNVASGQFPGDY